MSVGVGGWVGGGGVPRGRVIYHRLSAAVVSLERLPGGAPRGESSTLTGSGVTLMQGRTTMQRSRRTAAESLLSYLE